MGGYADDPVGTQDLPCFRKRQIILPEMNAVGPDSDCNVGVVVHEEQRFCFSGYFRKLQRGFIDILPGMALAAVLKEVNARSERGDHCLRGSVSKHITVQNQAEALDLISQ